MKKLFLLVVSLVFAAGAANAQDVFGKGDMSLNAGIGLGNSVYGSGFTNRFPPVSVSLEYGVVDNLINGDNGSIGVGGYLGYTGAKSPWTSAANYGFKYNSYIIAARGSFHYQFVNKLDTYAGLMLGYNVATAKQYGDWGGINGISASAGGFSFSIYIGARYYFTEAFGVYAELGYGVAFANLGVSFKF